MVWFGLVARPRHQTGRAKEPVGKSRCHFLFLCLQPPSLRPFGWGKILIGTGVGWIMGGKVHAQRKEKKLNAMHKKEQKSLYSQYYNDVYQLQQQNAEMSDALAKLGYRVK